ncbi:hypothetical protein ABB37_04037 [Leptomonas pyrrhocoris]|uniref:Uncharacterized protein n=1 Tax=Leptomonas pyrrhocoris TaxID=157538 RepID=A0A0N0DWF3_LEPPY|nr:hypothetical protein ABB37_04037 [Leptomonas pyrrhocoris]KPA81748.1 hypothetical protein ABB37_04037 [Leptomonas pyrrhocoris]|eukprot:XP_015660187.1 hypothetical protein ABB37_04037 [Leptomonas pyrrhocoris]
MIQLDFVLYRFVCDITAFTGLFAEDAEGRSIPDTAAFHCTWSRTPRSKQTAAAVTARIGGSTDSIYFKALGSDMALTFPTQAHQFLMDGEREVVTFALRPSQYSDDGALPIIAKGTLDPNPYSEKPKKNYAIRLRDAAGHVTGRLLFSLVAREIDGDHEQGTSADRAARSPKLPASHSREGSRTSLPKNPARDRLWKTSPPHQQPLASSTPPRVGEPTPPRRVHAGGEEQQQPTIVAAAATAPTSNGNSSPHRSSPVPSPRSNGVMGSSAVSPPRTTSNLVNGVESVDVQLERITVRSEGIDLDHPAPLLLGGDYSLKVRYGSFSYSTTRCTCRNPKEVQYRGQQTCIMLQPAPGSEKLRFSLWEDKKQVAGFSLDPAKFTAALGVWKEYAIPFRYHPTGQKAALDVRVRRFVVPLDGSLAGRHDNTPSLHRQPTMTTGATEPIVFPADGAVPRRLTYHAEPPSSPPPAPADTGRPLRPPQHTPLRPPSPPRKQPSQQHHQNVKQTSPEKGTPLRSSPLARGGNSSPAGSIAVTRGALQDALRRDGTPHRLYDAEADPSAHTGLRSQNPSCSVVRSGWVRTPMPERPSPLTRNLADLPADRRPPDDHEAYISEVLARLNRPPRGGSRQPTSLMEEWMSWRDDRERSRCNSVANSMVRSESVSSAVSRADSLASVTSRHASVPRATKSNADHSLMTPFTPDNGGFRRRHTSPSPAARNPLI